MTDIRKVHLPRIKYGNVTGEDLNGYMALLCREIFASFDARNPQSDFAAGVLANADGTVTLGTGAIPTGRSVSVATLVSRIGNGGRAADQRFLPMVNAGNRLSAQSAAPLTSTGTASTAAIAIAAHTVQYGFGTVSYGAGSITGLTPLTTYYVYADDPDYEGGAVTYNATTSYTTVVSDDGYYYVGAIVTANSTPTGNVTGATQANPCEVTVVAHPFTTGQSVSFADVGGMTELNGNTYVVTSTGVDTFTLNSTDSSAYGAYTTGGTATRVSVGTDGGYGGGFDPGYALP